MKYSAIRPFLYLFSIIGNILGFICVPENRFVHGFMIFILLGFYKWFKEDYKLFKEAEKLGEDFNGN